MSIKIWTAFRVPLSRLNEATDLLHEAMSEEFYKIWGSKLEKALSRTQKNENFDLIEWVIKFEDKIQQIQKENAFEFNSMYSSGFCFWIDSKFAYIIPYGTYSVVFPDWFEDFHYQDQTDRDENISLKKWRHRGKKWNEILTGKSENRKYTHKVVDPSLGFYIAFSDYTRKWVCEQTEEEKAS